MDLGFPRSIRTVRKKLKATGMWNALMWNALTISKSIQRDGDRKDTLKSEGFLRGGVCFEGRIHINQRHDRKEAAE